MANTSMRFAFLGTRGVPAQYGGFETAVEEVGRRLVERGHEVTVYCRNSGQTLREHHGMRLVNLPALRMRSLETLSHTLLSTLHSDLKRPDAVLLFNVANSPFVPLLRARRIPVAIHMDGLEWKRAKWQGAGARYYRWVEGVAARSHIPIVADSRGIQHYLLETYGRRSHYIAYGAPIIDPPDDLLSSLGVAHREYHLVVARTEPENHVDLILDGYLRSGSPHPLVLVGSAPYDSDYTRHVEQLGSHPKVRMLGSVWDQELLDQLYAHCLSYLHGHSVGGTNPSLLRAMGAGAPVTAFDVNFNREVGVDASRYFTNALSLAESIRQDDASPLHAVTRGREGQRHVSTAYCWDGVTDAYEQLLISLARHGLAVASRD